jgi:DNA-binding IclR family transcriptional regulator
MSRQQDPRIRAYILQHVEEYPGSIVSRAAEEFGLTRTGIARYIDRLVVGGMLTAQGNTKARRYRLTKNLQSGSTVLLLAVGDAQSSSAKEF